MRRSKRINQHSFDDNGNGPQPRPTIEVSRQPKTTAEKSGSNLVGWSDFVMPDEPIDERGWQLFFDVIDGRHPALGLERARREVMRLHAVANMPRPWLEKGLEYPSPWDEYSAWESWLDGLLPEGIKDEIDAIDTGVMSALYAVFGAVADRTA